MDPNTHRNMSKKSEKYAYILNFASPGTDFFFIATIEPAAKNHLLPFKYPLQSIVLYKLALCAHF